MLNKLKPLNQIFSSPPSKKNKVWPISGNNSNRVLVISMPKAGTYLFPEILRPMGFEFARLHVAVSRVKDYRLSTLDEAIVDKKSPATEIPFQSLIRYIWPGQCLVGHLRYKPKIAKPLSSWKIIYAYRNLRYALVSHMNWLIRTGRYNESTCHWKKISNGPERTIKFLQSRGKGHIRHARNTLPWFNHPQVLSVRFETILGYAGQDEQNKLLLKMMEYVESTNDNSTNILEQAFRTKTITSSPSHTKIENFWSPAVEDIFIKLGGKEINTQLGYEF